MKNVLINSYYCKDFYKNKRNYKLVLFTEIRKPLFNKLSLEWAKFLLCNYFLLFFIKKKGQYYFLPQFQKQIWLFLLKITASLKSPLISKTKLITD